MKSEKKRANIILIDKINIYNMVATMNFIAKIILHIIFLRRYKDYFVFRIGEQQSILRSLDDKALIVKQNYDRCFINVKKGRVTF